MTRDPIRRRYGHGAARLPLGLPPATERLSERARQPVPHERRLTLVLPLLTAAVALLIGSILQPPSATPTLNEPIQVVLESASIAPLALQRTPEPERAARRSDVEPARSTKPERALAQRLRSVPSARPGAAERAADSEKAFDVADLETRAPSFDDAPVLDDPPISAAASPSRSFGGRRTASASRTMPSGLAGAQHAPGDATDFAANAPPVPSFATTGERRPRAAGGEGSSGGGTSGTGAARARGGRGDADRRAFLAAVDREGEGGAGREGTAPTPRRPVVSAARSTMPSLSSGTSRNGADGWEEVPLDALPDCDPPGRQDLLKKRILLAAPFQRECSHPAGSFRFVETRNLGAFLMWSRPNPDARAGKPKDRDACDVLERALACIGDLPRQESTTR
jgi:hypothetical protein